MKPTVSGGSIVATKSNSKRSGRRSLFTPIRFVFRNRITAHDRAMATFEAIVLSKALNVPIDNAKLVYGERPSIMSIKVGRYSRNVRLAIANIHRALSDTSPPDSLLNAHCPECEFRNICGQRAAEKNDLSLLSGLSDRERTRLRSKGIFTVHQLSYTFRPRRRPKRSAGKREKYHHALKALAIREGKVHVVGDPNDLYRRHTCIFRRRRPFPTVTSTT